MSENEENKKMSGKPDFSVPENYFRRSASSILAHLEWLEENSLYPQLSKLKNKDVFKIPDDYFQLFGERVTSALEEDTILKGFEKKNSFTVPDDYFLSAENKITANLLKPRSANIILLWTRPLKYAAAVLIIAFAWWLYQTNTNADDFVDCKTMACVDKNELLQGRSLDNLEEEDLYDLVDSDELELSLDLNEANNELDSNAAHPSSEKVLDNG